MRYFNIVISCIIVFFSMHVHGKQIDFKPSLTNPVHISALSVEYNREENIYIAKGMVDLREGTRTLKADFVRYDENTKDLIAQGNVIFEDTGDIVECDRLELNLITKKGSLEKGRIFLKKGNFNISGEEIKKVGESTYTVKKGVFTTCDWQKPAWKFSASDVDITVEGYAKTKGAMFHIMDTPVFYLPWGIFPVKTERQSGFLLPEIALSTRDGAVIKNSYFYVISKDKDATFYLDFIEKRGFKLGTEFRYALKEDLKGSWYGSIIPDRKYDNTRYQIKGTHEQLFKDDLQLKMDVNHVFDYKHLEDFGTTTLERSENLLRSTAYLEKPFTKSLITYEVSYFKSLITKDNDSTFKYLPYITYFTEYLPLFKDRMFGDMYSEFVTFYREKGSTYSRLGIEPRVRFPFSFNGINLLVNGIFYETAYFIHQSDTEEKGTEQRQTMKIEADANVQLLKNYYTGFLGLGEMQSLIKPQLKYTFIPNTSFRDIPYITPYDRIYRTNTLTYSLNHYLNALTEDGYREISLLEIEQTYGLSGNLKPSDIYSGYGDRFSDIKARLTLYPKENLNFTNESIINTSGDGWKGFKNGFSYMQPNLYTMSISHNYTKRLTNEAYVSLGTTYGYIDGRFQVLYSFKDGMWINTLYQLVYHPKCWAITLTLTQTKRPRDTSVKIAFDLAGITKR